MFKYFYEQFYYLYLVFNILYDLIKTSWRSYTISDSKRLVAGSIPIRENELLICPRSGKETICGSRKFGGKLGPK